MGYDQVELSVVITDDAEIQSLNSTYRNMDKPTNVLAFPMAEGGFSKVNPNLLGDIVISEETAGKEAKNAGITLEERLSQLLVHGILHLVGFDHETGKPDADKMASKSIELLRIIEKNRNLDLF